MDCKDLGELISAYLDQELPGDEMVAVHAHVVGCDSCQSLIQEFQSQSMLTKNIFASVVAPEFIEEDVLREISSVRHSMQGFRLAWVTICSAVVMTVLAVGGGLTLAWSFGWTLTRMLFHLVHGIDVLLIQLVIGQGWTLTGMVAVGTLVAVVCIAGIGRLMKGSLGPKFS